MTRVASWLIVATVAVVALTGWLLHWNSYTCLLLSGGAVVLAETAWRVTR